MNPSRRQTNNTGLPSRRELAGLTRSLQARFSAVGDGFLLEIEPLSTVEAFSLWPELVPQRSSTMLVAIDDPDDSIQAPALTGDNRFTASLCEERLDATAVVVAADRLAEMAVVTPADTLVAIAIDGPVEAADADAVRRSISRGESPLATEVRAVLAATAIGERALRIEARDPEIAAAFVAEELRRYVAGLMNRWPVEIGRPEPELVLRVLDRTGHVSIRPIETEVYPTSIDVGLGTHTDGAARPAQASLIYDVCSATWHGE